MNDFDFVDFFQCNRTACQEKIIEIIQENKDKPIAIAINGKWGVGKTYFWKNTIAPLLADKLKKQTLYTSVFGKNNEQDIIQDLVAQFLKKTNAKLKAIKNISSIVTNAFGVNADIGFIFDLFEEKDLHNTIVCIDDFERLSDKIPLEDILGLICELKENKGCSVIVLYNEDELFKDKSDQEANQDKSEQARNKKIFEKYKEKVFDLQIKFSPPTTEQFSIFAPKDLSTDFDSYKYLPDILNIDKLLESHHSTNLRDLNRTNYIYHLLLRRFPLEESHSKEFEKTYRHLLYSIVYAYSFDLSKDYFKTPFGHTTTDLLSPYTSFYGELLRDFLPILSNALMAIQQTGFFYIPTLFEIMGELTPEERCRNYLKNLTNKIILDTFFHNDFLQELHQAGDDFSKASINFFLKHQNNLEALPYIFGFRILNYSLEIFDPKRNKSGAKGFLLDLIIREYRDSCLKLLNQWCDHAYQCLKDKWNGDCEEYFWINQYTFALPLRHLCERMKIDLPQNDLISMFLGN